MAVHKDMNFNIGVVANWFTSALVDAGANLSLTASSALRGTAKGLRHNVTFDGNAVQGLEAMTAPASNELRMVFWFDASTTFIHTADAFLFRVRIRYGGSHTLIQFDINTNSISGSNDYVIGASTREDGEPFDMTLFSGYGINDTDSNTVHCVDCRIVRESGASGNDGTIEIFIDGGRVFLNTTIQNFTAFSNIDRLVYTGFNHVASNLSGYLSFDEWLVNDDANADLSCDPAGNFIFIESSKLNRADIDASGEFIYVSGLDTSNNPILVKISTVLDANGTTVFNPGAGTNIGVECGRQSANTIWVAGNFGGTNVVEKSVNAGTSFAVRDDGTIGNVRTFVMGPVNDDRILVFDETNGDIRETRDNGLTWQTINAAVTPEINAVARLGKNAQESVFGNDGGANNSINYSVNSGADLEDYQTGVYPNANATKVIVN